MQIPSKIKKRITVWTCLVVDHFSPEYFGYLLAVSVDETLNIQNMAIVYLYTIGILFLPYIMLAYICLTFIG